MNEEQLAAARQFITGLFGSPFDNEWLMSEDETSSRVGKPLTGWFITIHDEVLSLSWADLTPDDVLTKLYAVIGWAVMNGVMVCTPLYTLMPPYKDRPGTIHHTDNRDAEG
jgi:hypothetical protein